MEAVQWCYFLVGLWKKCKILFLVGLCNNVFFDRGLCNKIMSLYGDKLKEGLSFGQKLGRWTFSAKSTEKYLVSLCMKLL